MQNNCEKQDKDKEIESNSKNHIPIVENEKKDDDHKKEKTQLKVNKNILKKINEEKLISLAKLDYLKFNYSNINKQGSEQWYNKRKSRFGGSELYHVIFSKNPETVEKLIIEKQKSYSEKEKDKNLYCYWGNIFEKVVIDWLQNNKALNIETFSNIACSNLPFAYSPDGLFISPINGKLYLLEIKCPFLKEYNKNKINKKYITQVQCGMHIIPIEDCLFITAIFRKCSLEDIINEDKKYHYDFDYHKKIINNKKNTYYYKPNAKDNHNYLFDGLIYWENNNMKELIESFEPSIDLNPLVFVSYSFNIKDVFMQLKDKKGYYMFFKCFGINEDYIEKDKDYFNKNNIIKKLWLNNSKLIQKFNELNKN